jgi:hypothetical protein
VLCVFPAGTLFDGADLTDTIWEDALIGTAMWGVQGLATSTHEWCVGSSTIQIRQGTSHTHVQPACVALLVVDTTHAGAKSMAPSQPVASLLLHWLRLSLQRLLLPCRRCCCCCCCCYCCAGNEDVKRLCSNPTLTGESRFQVGCRSK